MVNKILRGQGFVNYANGMFANERQQERLAQESQAKANHAIKQAAELPTPQNRSITALEGLAAVVAGLIDRQAGAGMLQGLGQGYQAENDRRQREYQDRQRGFGLQAEGFSQLAQAARQRANQLGEERRFALRRQDEERWHQQAHEYQLAALEEQKRQNNLEHERFLKQSAHYNSQGKSGSENPHSKVPPLIKQRMDLIRREGKFTEEQLRNLAQMSMFMSNGKALEFANKDGAILETLDKYSFRRNYPWVALEVDDIEQINQAMKINSLQRELVKETRRAILERMKETKNPAEFLFLRYQDALLKRKSLQIGERFYLLKRVLNPMVERQPARQGRGRPQGTTGRPSDERVRGRAATGQPPQKNAKTTMQGQALYLPGQKDWGAEYW